MSGDGGLAVTFIGTGTALPDPMRGPTSTLVQHAGGAIAFDLGSGALQKLARAGVTLDDLDVLLLTHAHLDHVADVLPLLFALTALPIPRRQPLEIVCSEGTRQILADAQAAFRHWLTPDDDRVCWRVVAPGDTLSLGDVAVTVGSVEHSDTSVGYRARVGGRTIAIPGDSGPCEGLVSLLRDVDLAVLECSVHDAVAVDGHLTPSTFIETVRAARPSAVALVHRYPSGPDDAAVSQIAASVGVRVWAPDDLERHELRAPDGEA